MSKINKAHIGLSKRITSRAIFSALISFMAGGPDLFYSKLPKMVKGNSYTCHHPHQGNKEKNRRLMQREKFMLSF